MKSNSNNTYKNIFLQMASLNLEGNIIPHSWYEAITFDNGKPHLPAIIILSDIVYWYKPEPVKDETTGKFLGYRKKIKEDLLQRSYKSFENQFGFSKKQIKTALIKLEELGLTKRIFRNIEIDNGSKLTNVMYIQIFPEKIKKLTYGHSSEIISSSTRSNEKHTYGHTGTEVCTSENPEKSRQGHTYGHTGTEVCTSMSRGYGHTGTEGMDIEGHTNTENTITEISITENNNSLNTTAPNDNGSFCADGKREEGQTSTNNQQQEKTQKTNQPETPSLEIQNDTKNVDRDTTVNESDSVDCKIERKSSARAAAGDGLVASEPTDPPAGDKHRKTGTGLGYKSIANKKPKINFNFETEEWENITESHISDWSEAFPACDIKVELKRMRLWLLANPRKRKKNYEKFILNWLSKQQDRGGTKTSESDTSEKKVKYIIRPYSA
ncbi:hypothetical protein [Deferribacter abyssi]|uniref:hypothetical protein n=1 Tax=Deferribacter abyssi TaxID=213806 RepID=UPI003C21E302